MDECPLKIIKTKKSRDQNKIYLVKPNHASMSRFLYKFIFKNYSSMFTKIKDFHSESLYTHKITTFVLSLYLNGSQTITNLFKLLNKLGDLRN